MPAPDKSFTVVIDSRVAPDATLDTTLMTDLRDNDLHLEEWMGKNYTAAVDHDHDGTNSKALALTGQVGQGDLKTSTGSGSVVIADNGNSSLALTNTYSFWTGSCSSGNGGFDGIRFGNGNTAAGTIGLFNGNQSSSNTFFMDERFIQASPPYNIGNKKWPHFFWLLWNKSTGEIFGSYETTDAHWGYRAEWIKDKNSPERIAFCPHPFAYYWDKPLPEGLEICLVDLDDFNIDDLKLDCAKQRKRPVDSLIELVNPGNKIITPQSLSLPNIPGFTDKVKIRNRI